MGWFVSAHGGRYEMDFKMTPALVAPERRSGTGFGFGGGIYCYTARPWSRVPIRFVVRAGAAYESLHLETPNTLYFGEEVNTASFWRAFMRLGVAFDLYGPARDEPAGSGVELDKS